LTTSAHFQKDYLPVNAMSELCENGHRCEWSGKVFGMDSRNRDWLLKTCGFGGGSCFQRIFWIWYTLPNPHKDRVADYGNRWLLWTTTKDVFKIK
jgi:hypothetical protein